MPQTYYVWYDAKGDDKAADSEIAGPVRDYGCKPAATGRHPRRLKLDKVGENAAPSTLV